jgi:GNAT superfamily N-acetyltransferase
MIATSTRPGRHDNDVVVLRPFGDEHLAGALRLSQEMSWPYRLEDWALALDLGQGLVLCDGAGAVIGTAVWWAYGEHHASAGMIIVAKAAQGRGHGARLMDALLSAAHPRALTLNSTAEGLALYARRGFVGIGVIHQHQGLPELLHQPPQRDLVRALTSSDVEAIARLDRECTGSDRRAMLQRLVQVGDGHLLVRDGAARGYAIARRFGRGHVIGPVVADSPADARALIEAAIERLGQTFVRVDTSASFQLGEWLERIGLHKVGEATTMVRGTPAPSARPARMFALASQSFN